MSRRRLAGAFLPAAGNLGESVLRTAAILIFYPNRFASRLGRSFEIMRRFGSNQEPAAVGRESVTPMAFGMTRISAGRFMALDLVGNAAWILAFTLAGYLFGEAYRYTFPAGRHGMFPVAIAIFIAGAAFFFWRRHRSPASAAGLGSPAG